MEGGGCVEDSLFFVNQTGVSKHGKKQAREYAPRVRILKLEAYAVHDDKQAECRDRQAFGYQTKH